MFHLYDTDFKSFAYDANQYKKYNPLKWQYGINIKCVQNLNLYHYLYIFEAICTIKIQLCVLI